MALAMFGVMIPGALDASLPYASAADGDVKSTVEINDSTTNGPTLANSDQFGISIANIGDLDGDGVNDLAVGARLDNDGGANRGAVHIIFMNTDGSVDSTVEINSSTTNGPTLTN
ncbi:MAG: integrin alpha, partial [Thermoproteota archaeon]|nr:integrin alpha [Thermoproteota archaeon]